MAATNATPTNSLPHAYASYGWPVDRDTLPIVYSPKYNITLFGLERLHPFDACKFFKVHKALRDAAMIADRGIEAREVDLNTLLSVHDREYINRLHTSPAEVARVIELPILRFVPNSLLQALIMRKMRHHVGGTILAVGLAAAYGCAINLGGGCHHAYHGGGMGWCPYSDITLAIQKVRVATNGRVDRVMVIDTDAHQGNGVERDKQHFDDKSLFIVDLFNEGQFPLDHAAKSAIDVAIPFRNGADDAEYLSRLDTAISSAFEQFTPHLVIHNAGSDILAGDPLGRMSVSGDGVAERDLRVWRKCREAGIPVCMLLSGGYARDSARVVSMSLIQILQEERRNQHRWSLSNAASAD